MFFKKKAYEDEDDVKTSRLKLWHKVAIGIFALCFVFLFIPQSAIENLVNKANRTSVEEKFDGEPLTGDVTIGDLVSRYESLRSQSDESLFDLSEYIVARPEVGSISEENFDTSSISDLFVKDLTIPTQVTGVEPVYSDEDLDMMGYSELDKSVALSFLSLTVDGILDSDFVRFRLTGTDNYLYVKFLVLKEKYEVGDEVSLTVLHSLYSSEDENTGYAFYVGGVV